MTDTINYRKAVLDFQDARRKAELQALLGRIRGESNELLSFEVVRQALKAIEGNQKKLSEIPLDAIIGSVGRYSDFTRNFLPLRDTTQQRWARIMEKALDLEGLPPIDVYQIGEAFFVLDGNHRVSVARQLGATQIQAYVTEVRSRIPISANIQPDELIIVAEHLNFFEHTKLDELRPDADLKVTIPGQFPILEEHISVHQYYMGIDQERKIKFQDAVVHWYDHVYLPVVEVIREHQILDKFPDRTETDLYLWISRHQSNLEQELGWAIDAPGIAEDLVYKFSPNITTRISKMANRILDIMIPDPLETGPPVGHWRKKYIEPFEKDSNSLFNNIIIPLGKDTNQWDALDQAIYFAWREGANLRGLHIFEKPEDMNETDIDNLRNEFSKRCQDKKIKGELAIDVGGISRRIIERSHWADLVVLLLAHPPEDDPIKRFESGFRTVIRRCPRPVLAVPSRVSRFHHPLLAYSSSPKAKEALYIAAYMASKWNSRLTVLTIDQESTRAAEIQAYAHNYLQELDITADFIYLQNSNYHRTILDTADEIQADSILMGGYKATPLVEIVLGSVLDQILRETSIPVLVCR